MAKGKSAVLSKPTQERIAHLSTSEAVGGVSGPGRWLLARFLPTGLFSLKISLATSSMGKSLILPTPYSIKMAIVDAAFRLDYTDEDIAKLLEMLVPIQIRISPAEAIVTHTFVKVRQEARTDKEKAKGSADSEPTDPNAMDLPEKGYAPYTSSIAYREVVFQNGVSTWGFDLAAGDDGLANYLPQILPHLSYIGKRGSFIQFLGFERTSELGSDFTQPFEISEGSLHMPEKALILPLDDFGPDADLETLSSFAGKRKLSRDKHRKFVQTIVPLGLVNTGPGFSEYGR